MRKSGANFAEHSRIFNTDSPRKTRAKATPACFISDLRDTQFVQLSPTCENFDVGAVTVEVRKLQTAEASHDVVGPRPPAHNDELRPRSCWNLRHN